MSLSLEANQCPYCPRPVVHWSRDHIFSDFLGGTRTISACKPCNDFFGGDFEARAASMLTPHIVELSGWGLSLAVETTRLRRAGTKDGRVVDIKAGPGHVITSPSAPTVSAKARSGEIASEFRTLQEAKRFLKENPHLDATIIRKQLEGTVQIPTSVSTGADMQRLALKMCIALSRISPTFSIREISSAQQALYSGDMTSRPVETAFDDYPLLDERRPDLAHTIYVERGEKVTYGIVQFFGVFQFYCELGKPTTDQRRIAIMGSLDPLNGAETFGDVTALNLFRPPSHRLTKDIPKLVEHWEDKFRRAAVKRGAKPDAKREITEIKLNPKFPPSWKSGTIDMLLRVRDKEDK